MSCCGVSLADGSVDITRQLGHEVDEVKKRVAMGLRRLSNYLGGLPARQCPNDCPDCKQRQEEAEEAARKAQEEGENQ